MREYEAYIFDLDGTLLDTLPDLVVLTNMVLEEAGYPSRSRQEIHSFVGGGLGELMRRAASVDIHDAVVEGLMIRWKELYPEHGTGLAKPYPNIDRLIDELREKKLAVLSNKFDAGAQEIIEQFFPQIFSVVHGESPEIPRKPDPTGLKKTLSELGINPEHAVYIGDSPNDIVTAEGAGTHGIAVSWGYHEKSELVGRGISRIVDDPLDILPTYSA